MEAFGSNLSEEQVIISFVLASGICIWLTQPVVRTCMCTYKLLTQPITYVAG